jgi:hypothetical protein
MTTRDNVHPIKPDDLHKHMADAEFRMQNVPQRGVAYDLLAELRKLPGAGGYLLNEPVNHVLHTLRRGLCLYYELYEELSGTFAVSDTRLMGSFALFGMAALIAHELPAPADAEGLASFPKPPDDFFRVGLGPDDDLKAVLSLYLRAVTQSAPDGEPLVEQADDLVNLTHDYFVAARDAMIAGSDALPTELVAQLEAVTFRVEGVNLELRGFRAEGKHDGPRVEFNPVQPDQVVGNVVAKRALLRYTDRLALFDAATGANPILDLGGLPSSVLFDGFPGTGKTSLFRMAMTRLQQRGEQVGLPTRFVLIDTSIKDEYYGKTGKLLRERLETVRDTSTLTLLFFDDIDLLVASRQGGGNDNGSDRDILTITMQFFDGIMTRFVGNYQAYAATNEPTALDAALRQRFHHRDLIAGPEDWDDYAALLAVKLAKQLGNGLVSVGGPVPSVAQAAQTTGLQGDGQAAGGQSAAPKLLDRARSLLNGSTQQGGVSWRELGELCVELKRNNERFTGRPIESVVQRLLAESADFDIPPEWFSEPTHFLQQPYAQKVALLKALYRPITGDMIARELEAYAAGEQRYGDDAKRTRAERLAADMEAQRDAHALLEQRAAQSEG